MCRASPPAGFTFNQFLVLGDEPLMFHTGLKKMFPLNHEALSRIISARATALGRIWPFRDRQRQARPLHRYTTHSAWLGCGRIV